ncbi:MAG TPA: hypothetical protein VGE88_14560, partial [Lysobacter sp.]
MEKHEDLAVDVARRDLLRTTGTAMLAGLTAATIPGALSAAPQGQAPAATSKAASLGARLQGVQHFGLTVQT